MASLVILTTCGRIEYLKNALTSLIDETSDILVIDDGSNIDYSDLSSIYNFEIIQKLKGRGLTDSWNIGYRYFMGGNYDRCVLSNDDVIFPSKIPLDMWNGLNKYKLIGPLSDPIGCGRFTGRFQDINRYLRRVKDYKDVITINNRLQDIHPNKRFLEIGKDITLPREEPPYINGFCFSFDRRIEESEYEEGVLFNPEKINTGNEKEHQRCRLLDDKAISIKSYVFHYKGQSFKENRQDRRQVEELFDLVDYSQVLLPFFFCPCLLLDSEGE